MTSSLPTEVNAVIIGGGPASLICAYILHGHIPTYAKRHSDALLDSKLANSSDLLHLTPDLYAHFHTSLRYSTQALPINTLLDTLIRPNADTEINPRSCIEWRYEPERAVSHVVLGDAPAPGGQWQDNPVSASAAIGALSYAEQLALPGYSYAEYYSEVHGKPMPDFIRPSRREVAAYLRRYASAVGISDSIYSGQSVHSIARTSSGFYIGSHGIHCKHLVLASGIFSQPVPPPSRLLPLLSLPKSDTQPLLVIGSGFSAADVIISTPPSRPIIHIFKWSPSERPSPLKGCHHQAYPEYAGVYRQMKLAAASFSGKTQSSRRPMLRRKSTTGSVHFGGRDWASTYTGYPNATIESVFPTSHSKETATITLSLPSGNRVTREVGELTYVVGRRGSIAYLDDALRKEVLSGTDAPPNTTLISGRTLRAKAEVDLEVAPGVHIVGALAGDSLIRHAIGSSVQAAGRIMNDGAEKRGRTATAHAPQASAGAAADDSADSASDSEDGSAGTSVTRSSSSERATEHEDLHIDRKQLAKSSRRPSVDEQVRTTGADLPSGADARD